MTLKHDAQGFLVGDPVDLSEQIDIWKDIKSDVAAIKRLLSRMARPAGEVGSPVKPPAEIAMPGGSPKAPISKGGDPIKVDIRVAMGSEREGRVGGGAGGAGGAGGVGGDGGAGGAGGDGRTISLPRDKRGRFVSPAARRISASGASDRDSNDGDQAQGAQAVSVNRAAAPGLSRDAAPTANVGIPGSPGIGVGAVGSAAGAIGVDGDGVAVAGGAVGAIDAAGSPGRVGATRRGTIGATAVARDSAGRFVQGGAVARSAGAVAMPTPNSSAQRNGRDSSGKFVRGGGGGAGGAGGSGSASISMLSSAIRGLADATLRSGSDMGEADPAVKAISEVAQPLARGWGAISAVTGGGGGKRQEGWLRRIFTELKVFRKEETGYSKASERRLKAIEEKPAISGDGGGSGIFSVLLSLLMKLPLLAGILSGLIALISKAQGFVSKAVGGLLGKLIGSAGAAGVLKSRRGTPGTVTPATVAGQRQGTTGVVGGAASGAGSTPGASPGASTKGGGAIGRAGGIAAKLGKRIPVLGALVALGMGVSEARSTESDDSLTREQKNVEHSKTAGGAVGGIAGAAAGAAIGSVVPVVGTVIGGILGAVLGDWLGREGGRVVGENLDRISTVAISAWQSIEDSARSVWELIKTSASGVWESMRSGWTASMEKLSSFIEFAKSGWESITNLFKSAYEGLKSLPVIGSAIKAAEELAKKAAAQAAPVIAKVKDKAVEVGQKAAQVVKSAAAQAAPAVAAAKDKAIEVGSQAMDGAKQGIKGATAAAERAYNVTAATTGSALETVMPKGYRHKALFDGIKGGDSLTKYGSYTDEEAAKIRELKTSGANTSANVKGGMSSEVQDKISAQAKKAGLDPVMMQKIAAMESGGNANAISSTGAVGIYQFTGQTASGVGIKNRFDVDQNIEGGMRLTKQNQAALEKAGLPVSAENLYMMHQLGPSAAKEVISGALSGKSKAEMSPATQKAMNLNYGANSKTAADYIATNKKALDDRYAAVTKDVGGSQMAAVRAQQAPSASASTGSAPSVAENTQQSPDAVVAAASSASTPTVSASLQGGEVPAAQPAAATPSQPSAPQLTFKDIGGGDYSVTNSETGVTELATPEQVKQHHKQRGREYLDALAAANNPDNYKPKPTPTVSASLQGGEAPAAQPGYQDAPRISPATAAAAPVLASVQIPSPPVMAKPIQIPDAPPVVTSAASSHQVSRQTTHQTHTPEVGRDVADRRIAHIVTGGLA